MPLTAPGVWKARTELDAGDQVAGTDAQMAGLMLVKAKAPLAELTGYQTRLNALTSGQGRFSLTLSHYEPVPPNVQNQLTSGHQLKDD